MISIAGLTGRVTKWKDTKMINRWVAAGMLEAERSFRRIKGHDDMKTLVVKVVVEVAVPRRRREGEGRRDCYTHEGPPRPRTLQIGEPRPRSFDHSPGAESR